MNYATPRYGNCLPLYTVIRDGYGQETPVPMLRGSLPECLAFIRENGEENARGTCDLRLVSPGRGIVEVPYRAGHHPSCLCSRCICAKRRETDSYFKQLDMRDVD
jgi:hypothetical protein